MLYVNLELCRIMWRECMNHVINHLIGSHFLWHSLYSFSKLYDSSTWRIVFISFLVFLSINGDPLSNLWLFDQYKSCMRWNLFDKDKFNTLIINKIFYKCPDMIMQSDSGGLTFLFSFFFLIRYLLYGYIYICILKIKESHGYIG